MQWFFLAWEDVTWVHYFILCYLQLTFKITRPFILCILHYLCDCMLQVTCKQESVLLFSDQKTVNSWIDALTKAIQ